MTSRRIGAAFAHNPDAPRANTNRLTNPCLSLGRFVLRTTAEAGVVGLGGLAATMGAPALIWSTVGTAFGAGKGVAMGSQRSLDRVFFRSATKGLLIGPGVLWLIEKTKDNFPIPSLVNGIGSYLLSSGLVAGAVRYEETPEGMNEPQQYNLMTSRIIEWGTGAAVGTLVTGVATSTIGFGLGIAAGVATMKATRFGVRALLGI